MAWDWQFHTFSNCPDELGKSVKSAIDAEWEVFTPNLNLDGPTRMTDTPPILPLHHHIIIWTPSTGWCVSDTVPP